ncbi:unnamed protein product [Brassica napus]|uniref:(rape) hypothetical protein n=1 Tax=Brassica napus TaxID=3708 RepID=A0A817AJY0_BRANA|nr:unnamed protein product [Brassica napus]
MASRSDMELEDEAALILQPEGLGASAVVAFEEEEAAEAHRSTSDEWWNLPIMKTKANVSILFRNEYVLSRRNENQDSLPSYRAVTDQRPSTFHLSSHFELSRTGEASWQLSACSRQP